MRTVAYFPWLKLHEDRQPGGFRLLRFDRGKRPSGAGTEMQEVFDAVLEPYSMGGRRVTEATILQPPGHELGAEVDEQTIDGMFAFSELLAFSALADREFFMHVYQNRDNFRLVVQNVLAVPKGAVTQSRRRDGSSLGYWSKGTYRVQKPEHIPNTPNSFDVTLIGSLQRAQSSNEWDRLFESIVSFNLANTDSPDLPEQVEAILLVGAFERLLGCNRGKEREVAERLADTLVPSNTVLPEEIHKFSSVSGRYKHSRSVRDVWIRDFYRFRSRFAHGSLELGHEPLWNLRNHLLLASYSFPLLVKLLLQKLGYYSLTSFDKERVDMFEQLALHDHFAPRSDSDEESSHPWEQVRQRFISDRIARGYRKHQDKVDSDA
jgi:hypothetical protein